MKKLFLFFFVIGLGMADEDPCAPDCVNNELLPHPQDCSVFYHCSHGNPFLENCPPGLEFSPSILQCVFPQDSGCTADPNFICGEISTTSAPSTTEETTIEISTTEEKTTSTIRTTSPESTTVATTEAETTVRETTTTESSECVLDCPSSNAIFANPKDCSTYFMCFGGVPYLQTCPLGNAYNPATQTCEDEGTFECTAGSDQPCAFITTPSSVYTTTEQIRSTTTEQTGSSATDTSKSSAETTQEATTTQEPSECVPDCLSSNTLFANPKDCSSYFMCFSGIPYFQSCPPGKEYNPATQDCDDVDNFVCTAGPDQPCKFTSTTASALTSTSAKTTTVDRTDTTSTSQTTEDIITETSAQETTVGRTTTTETEVCELICPSSSAIFANPKDCATYYMCFNNDPYLQTCPLGKEYDPATQSCENKDTFQCTAGPNQPCTYISTTSSNAEITTDQAVTETTEVDATTTATTLQRTTGAMTAPTTESASSTAGPTTTAATSLQPTTADAITTTADPVSSSGPITTEFNPAACTPMCPSDSAIYPNPRNCDTYFQCYSGVPFLMTCNIGEQYNPTLEKCDNADNVTCTSGPNQPCVAVINPLVH